MNFHTICECLRAMISVNVESIVCSEKLVRIVCLSSTTWYVLRSRGAVVCAGIAMTHRHLLDFWLSLLVCGCIRALTPFQQWRIALACHRRQKEVLCVLNQSAAILMSHGLLLRTRSRSGVLLMYAHMLLFVSLILGTTRHLSKLAITCVNLFWLWLHPRRIQKEAFVTMMNAAILLFLSLLLHLRLEQGSFPKTISSENSGVHRVVVLASNVFGFTPTGFRRFCPPQFRSRPFSRR